MVKVSPETTWRDKPMAKKLKTPDDDSDYHRALYDLQVELVKLQRQLIADGERVLVIVEGRDAAGKDGVIKRLTEHMSPRETRIHAPGKPSSREETEWYFQRFVPFLPAAQEFVIATAPGTIAPASSASWTSRAQPMSTSFSSPWCRSRS